MQKHLLKITTLIIISVIIIVYGWNWYQRINYNRLVFESDIYTHVPHNAKAIINFSRQHHFDEYFQIDTTNTQLINYIKEDITFPLVIVKLEKGKDDLLLMRATKEQEEQLKIIFAQKVAPHHAPTLKKYEGINVYFHSLSNNEFIVSCFNKGVYAISKDYILIQQFITQNYSHQLFDLDNAQMQHYADRLKENAPISIFTYLDSTAFALSYEQQRDTILLLDGEYYGKLEHDSLKLSYNEMNQLLKLESYYTDSIDWQGQHKIKIWLNKHKE